MKDLIYEFMQDLKGFLIDVLRVFRSWGKVLGTAVY